jgi:hypothetical protein
MLLRVPDEIDPLWEGELEADPDAVGTRGDPQVATAIRELPVVSIGKPESWPLLDLYEADKVPVAMRALMSQTAFHVVRLSCSFRPVHDRTRIEWARFAVSLQPDAEGRTATAFDLHPLLVTQEVKRNVKVSLAPTIKFQEVEAGLGGVDVGFEYPQLEPVISASGAGETEPAWDFSSAKGAYIHGSKWMHLVVALGRGMTSCDAHLHLTADVVSAGLRIPVFSRPKQAHADPLSVRLCG